MIRTSAVNYKDGRALDKEMDDELLAMAIEGIMARVDPNETCELFTVEFHFRGRRDPHDSGSTQVEALDLFAGGKIVFTFEPWWKQTIRKIFKL